MKKLIISESQYQKHSDLLKECNCMVQQPSDDIEEGKRATIHVANQVRNTTNREETHVNDMFDDHEKKKISLGKFLDSPSNHERLKRGMEIIDNEGNVGTLQAIYRLKRGYKVDYLDRDGQSFTKNALSVYLMV